MTKKSRRFTGQILQTKEARTTMNQAVKANRCKETENQLKEPRVTEKDSIVI